MHQNSWEGHPSRGSVADSSMVDRSTWEGPTCIRYTQLADCEPTRACTSNIDKAIIQLIRERLSVEGCIDRIIRQQQPQQ